MTRASRSIDIDVRPAEVASFLERVPNLPRWTRFFTSVRGTGGSDYEVTTIRGVGRTQTSKLTSPEEIRVEIKTRFEDCTETAMLGVAPSEFGARVTFSLTAPNTLVAQQLERMLEVLEGELSELKDVLEAGREDWEQGIVS